MSEQVKLPSGWKLTTLGEISDVIGGGTPKTNIPEYFEGGTIPWITPADLSGYTNKHISHGGRFITEEGLKNSSARMMPAGTILFTSRAPVGYVAISANPVCTNQGFKSFVLKEGISPDYVYWYLKGSKELAESMASGTTFLELSGAKAKQIPFPLAPLEDQKQIVAEIEKQFSRLDEAVASLKRIQANLKRYKAAVLKAAVEGKLTEEWRKDHPEVEPADQLLKRILAERRDKWEESVGAKQGVSASPGFGDVGNNVGDCKKGEAGESFASPLPQMKAKRSNPKDDSWKKKYKEPAGPDTANLPELPEGWVWASVEQLADIMLGKMLDKAKHLSGNKLPYLRNVNIRWGLIETEDLFEMFFEDNQLERYGLKSGDVLVCEGGEPGRAAVWNGKFPEMKYQKALHRVCCSKGYEPQILVVLLEHLAKSGRLEKWFTGSTIKHFTRESFIQLPVPLPSVLEQKIILDEIDRRLSVTEELEFTIETNLKRAECLRQTILHRAFSGGLV